MGVRHPLCGKTPFKLGANLAPVHVGDLSRSSRRGIDGTDDTAADAVRNDFRHGPVGPSDHRRSSRHCFDHDEPERLWPVDRKQKRARVAEKFALLGFADFAYELDEGMVKKRFDLGLEIRNINGVHLCRELQGDTGSLGDFYRAVRALFGRDTSEESQIAAAIRVERADARHEAVRDRGEPIGIRWHWTALRV